MKENETAKCVAATEIQAQITNLNKAVGELAKTIQDTRILLTELAAQVKYTACPSPGACVKLADELKEVRGDVEELKKLANQWVGRIAAIAALATASGSVIGGFIMNLISK